MSIDTPPDSTADDDPFGVLPEPLSLPGFLKDLYDEYYQWADDLPYFYQRDDGTADCVALTRLGCVRTSLQNAVTHLLTFDRSDLADRLERALRRTVRTCRW